MRLENNGFLFISFFAPRLHPRLLYLAALRIYGRAEKCNNVFCGLNERSRNIASPYSKQGDASIAGEINFSPLSRTDCSMNAAERRVSFPLFLKSTASLALGGAHTKAPEGRWCLRFSYLKGRSQICSFASFPLKCLSETIRSIDLFPRILANNSRVFKEKALFR